MYSKAHSTCAKRFLCYTMRGLEGAPGLEIEEGSPEAVLTLGSERLVEVNRVRGQYSRKKKESRVGGISISKEL